MPWWIAAVAITMLTAGSASGAEDSQPAKADRKLCRSIVATGSVLPKKFCLTKAEWAEFNRLNDEDSDAALRKRINIAPPPPPA